MPTLNAHPTIRALSGAAPREQLPAGATALIVIDFQSEYFSGRMPIPDGLQALEQTERLLQWADAGRIPVFHVQHIAPEGSAVFALGGDTVRFHPRMQPREGDAVVQKRSVSAFAGTELAEQLRARGISTLVIAGLMTHACVAGAARDAVPLGFEVVVASDAAATRAITRADGQGVEADALHRATLASIEDTFGDVLPTAQILALPLR
jgi:nicotinamidase-related amidase